MKRLLMTIVLILGLLLLVMPIAVSAASGITVVDRIGDGVWEGSTWQVEIYPGEAKSTILTLYNSSSSPLDVEVTIIPDSLDNGNLTFELSETNFTMPGRSNVGVILTANASGSATPGTYTAELTIKSEVPPTPTPSFSGGGGISLYSIETNLFGVEKTYYTEYDGDLRDEISGTSQDGNLTITILEGTIALDEEGKRLGSLEVLVNENPPEPPKGSSVIGLAYDFEPTGATFDPPITFTWVYDPEDFPGDVTDLVLAYYDKEASEWIELPCIVDPTTCTVTASVSHFTTFAIIGFVPPMPPLPEPDHPEEPEEPEVIEPEEPVEELEESEVVEPEEPEVIEPEVIEPDVKEPKVSWLLTIGLTSSLIVIAGVVCWFWLRRRRRRSREREGVSS